MVPRDAPKLLKLTCTRPACDFAMGAFSATLVWQASQRIGSKMAPPARTLQPEELRWLVCPVCHQTLTIDADAVRCIGCARRYPVVDGIPELLPGRAS
jgi:uncharacterized protein YbaR (Trm112 family)